MKRGEIWFVDFGVPSGPEQSGKRPAVIIQDDSLSESYTTLIVIPITTNFARSELPTTVVLDEGEGGLPRESVVLCHHVQVRGKARLISRYGALDSERITQIESALLHALGL